MKFWTWFRNRTPDPIAACAACGTALIVCPDCGGAWRGRHCGCGLGHLCPLHGRHHR